MLSSLRAFKNSDYRLYFIGQLLSLSGTFMQAVAQAWLVYRLTNSAAWLGIVTFCTQAPAFLLCPVAGILNDRFDRRRMLLIVQWLAMAQAFILAGLVYTGTVTIWQIVALAITLGMINAFEMTTRQSFVIDLVGKEDLQSAIALNSVIMNGSRIFGPALAGIIIDLTGEKFCFLINGFSYFAAIYSLTHLRGCRNRLQTPRFEGAGFLSSMREAIIYVRATPLILKAITICAFVSFVTPTCVVLLPVFAKTVLHGGANIFAWLTSMVGLGAIIGALSIEASFQRSKFRRIMLLQMGMIGVMFILFGFSRTLWLSLAAVFLIGLFQMSIYPRINSAIQLSVDDRLRGRVISLYNMTFLGTMPLGALIAGWTSDRIGARKTLFCAGTILVTGAIAITAQRLSRKSARA